MHKMKCIILCLPTTIQFSSVAQSCPTLCNPMNRKTPGLPVHQQLPEFTQTHVQRFSDAIQPSQPLSSPSPPAPNPSQHQSLFQWVNSSSEEAKVLEFQPQHQSFQWHVGNYYFLAILNSANISIVVCVSFGIRIFIFFQIYSPEWDCRIM